LTAPSLRIDISLVTNTTIETATVASKAGARWRAHVSAVFRACMPLVLCPLVAHAASFELAATLENPEGSEGSAFSGFFGAALATNGGSVVVTAPGNRFDPSAGERRGAIYQYDARTRARVRDFATPGFGRAFGVVIAVRGNLLAAAEIDGDYGVSDIARLFDLASGRLLRIIYRALSLVEVDASLVFTAGGRLVTGSPFADAAHVFDPATGEIRRTIMNPTNPVPEYGDLFGTHLAAAGRHILVGAPGDDTAGLDAGAAYLIDPETGGLVRTFLNPEPSETREFPHAMLAVGSRVVIGAPCSFVAYCATTPHLPCVRERCRGAVHVFDVGTGDLLGTYTSPRVTDAEPFGTALASWGTSLLIGNPSPSRLREPGAVFLLSDDGRLLHTFQDTDPTRHGGFGAEIVAVGDDVWIGAPHEEGGRVFVFADTCGNGRLDLGERCDDGNRAARDGCAPDCRLESCGDGRLDSGEACDDDNAIDGDGCDTDCTPSGCGNGVVAGAEQCDDANAADGDGCDDNCTVSRCGNGIRTGNEECDDGNILLGDGCDIHCRVEKCGNGEMDAGESCDDGNRDGGDGCSGNCRTGSDGGDWLRLAGGLLPARDPDTAFGVSMTVLDRRLYVGQVGESDGVRIIDATTGARLGLLSAPEQESWDFGTALATVGSSLLVGDPGANEGQGAAYVIEPASGALERKLTSPVTGNHYAFGKAVAALGDDALVATFFHRSAAPPLDQAAYRFDVTSGSVIQTYARPPGAEEFGRAIAGVGSRVAVGALGAVFLFDADTGALVATLNGSGADQFGAKLLAVGGNVLVSDQGRIWVIDGGDGSRLRSYPGYDWPLDAADGILLVGGPGCGLYEDAIAAHLIDDASGRPLATLCNPRYDSYSRYASIGLLAAGNAFVADSSEDVNQVWMFAPCADGILAAGEECDDGNQIDGDGCDRNCTLSRCGNGRRPRGEPCQDDLAQSIFDAPGLLPPICGDYDPSKRLQRRFARARSLVRAAATTREGTLARTRLGRASVQLRKALRELRTGDPRLRGECSDAIAKLLRTTRDRVHRASRRSGRSG
jgi:cysteine-rich repeat protein